MKNWKTTALGVLAILGALTGVAQSLLHGTPVDWGTAGPAIMAGIGLIFSKDSNVTGGTVQQ